MSGLWTIFRRESSAYFNSAIASIFLIVFALFTSGLFMLQFFQIGKADMRPLFASLPFVLNIFIPAIAMRLWAEDRRGSTYELLLTFPMRPYELVLGKYLASLLFYAATLLSTATVPMVLAMIGRPDWGPVIGGYLGALLLGALFLAIGIFVSGFCRDQIVAFVLAVLACFVFYIAGTDFLATFIDGWVPGAGSLLRDNLGVARRLGSFGRGVLDGGDVAYFLIWITAFLSLNSFSLEGRLRPGARAVFSGAVAVVALSAGLLSWVIQDAPLGRADLTEGKVYTISDASLKILRSLKVPVTVKLYISPQDAMPTALKTLERDVVDKLEELRVASQGKFRYKVVHQEPLTKDAADEGVSLKDRGVIPFQVESVQRDEVGVKLIYSTLIIEYKEKPNEIIPRVVPQTIQDLEHQLISRVHKLTLEEKPRVVFYASAKAEELSPELAKVVEASGAKEARDYQDSYKTASLLLRNNGYQVARIALTKDDGIPEKTAMLFVLDPGTMSARQRFEINRYLRGGGTVIVGAEPFEFSYRREESGVEAVPSKKPLDINALIEPWGVKISPDILCDARPQVISIMTGHKIGPYALEMPVKFPNQILIDDSTFNRATFLTNRLPSVFYLWGAALEVSAERLSQAGLRSTTLFTSGPSSWKLPNDGTARLTAASSVPPQGKLEGGFPLAVLIEGTFTDPFNGTEAPAWEEGGEAGPKMGEGKPGRLVVIGSSKIFAEDLIQSPGNINLFANIVDGFVLGEDLVKIRSKITVPRDIRRLSDAEKAGLRFLAIGAVPMLVALLAGVRMFVRAKEKELYLSARQRNAG